MPVCAATGALSAGAIGYSLYRLRHSLGDRVVPLMGVMSAGIFAGQMVNFPLVPLPVSGHLLGGVLAGIVLGPWAGAVAITVVLLVQALLFVDGGVTALGANVFNIAVLGSMVSYAVYAPVRQKLGGNWGIVAGAVVAAWVSVVLASIACSLQISLSSIYRGEAELPLSLVLPWMLLFHALIGIAESLITGYVVLFIVRVRPDLIYGSEQADKLPARIGQLLVGGLAITLVIAAFLSPLASQYEDGLEAALTRITEAAGQPAASESDVTLPTGWIPDYEMPGMQGVWYATSIAGVIGSLVVLVLAVVLAWGVRAKPPAGSR